MKLKQIRQSYFGSHIRELWQSCLTLNRTDVINPKASFTFKLPNQNSFSKYEKFVETDEVNHKEIRYNALQLLRRHLISQEEYVLVLDADLKYLSSCSVEADADVTHTDELIDHKIKIHQTHLVHDNISRDPITLDELGNNVFTFVTPHGNEVKYNIKSLVEYISSTGDIRDPVTRYLFSQDDIDKIDLKIKGDQSCQRCSSLKDTIDKMQAFSIKKQKKEECQNLETCLGEIIVDVREVLETPALTHQAADVSEMKVFSLLSEFEGPFSLFKALDIENAYQSLLSWKVFLHGHPKKPTKLLAPESITREVNSFLEGLWTQEDQQSLQTFRFAFEE